ncbi:MAG: serine hydrolase [Pseudomonadota bacterium]
MTEFASVYGFERGDVTLANWRETPFSRFAFSHVNEIVPSALVHVGCAPSELKMGIVTGLADLQINDAGNGRTLIGHLEKTDTDVFVIWHDGAVVFEYAAPWTTPRKPHIIFSISKSVTGLLAGILKDQGLLEFGKPVGHYLPETRNSGFGDCSLQHLMDMRISLDFVEEYLNADGDYARYRGSTNWNPTPQGKRVETLAQLLFSLGKTDEAHGGSFRYLSPASDMLGMVVEAVSGMRYTEFMAEVLWQPLGAAHPAMMTVDLAGTPRGAGGLSVAAHDLLRVGLMVLDGGASNGNQIISEAWVNDMLTNGDDEAWRTGDFETFVVRGRYRNQWYQMPRGRDAFFGVGIHGQWLYVDRPTRTAIVKLSSQSVPQDDALDQRNLALFNRIVEAIG